MMTRLYLRLVISIIFIAGAAVALGYGKLLVDVKKYFLIFALYLAFSILFVHLKTLIKTGSVNIDYSISYSFSFILLTGPSGLFLFEVINRFYVYFHRRVTGNADEDELLHTFYNIVAPTLFYTFGFYCFQYIYPVISEFPFAFWLLLFFLTIIMDIISSCLLLIIIVITGNIQSKHEAVEFISGRSVLDLLKTSLTNGLIVTFLIQEQWEASIAVFLINYIVGRAGVFHTKLLQQKLESDRFKRMAYTDFLTKIHNRTYMNKVMNELSDQKENLAFIVTDIDAFKKINDTFNHAVGDRVIQHFAKHLQQHLKNVDYLFRTGGEEFTIILRKRSYEECKKLLEQMKKNLLDTAAQAEFKSKKIEVPYTASFGMYYVYNDGKVQLKRAYVYADDLLLEAKHNGKNQIMSANANMAH